MSDGKFLCERTRSAPLFILSFTYRNALAAQASAQGWRVIASRRRERATLRFIASGAMVAVIDLRGAAADGLAAVHDLVPAAETNGAALVVLGGRGQDKELEAALRAGASHVMCGPITDIRLAMALCSAEYFVSKLLDQNSDQIGGGYVERQKPLSWQLENGRVQLSPTLSTLLKFTQNEMPLTTFVGALPPAAHKPLLDCLSQIQNDQQPRALTHALFLDSIEGVAHHLRVDTNTEIVEGLIEYDGVLNDGHVNKTLDLLTGTKTLTATRNWLVQHSREGQILLVIGLTQFELINAAFGRITGDMTLRALGRRIGRCVDELCPPDTLSARIAGTVFLIAFKAEITMARLRLLISMLTTAIEQPIIAEGHEVRVGVTLAAVKRRESESAATLLRRASATLAKAEINNGSQSALAMIEPLIEAPDDSLATDLRNALDRQEIEVLFQPQLAISTGAIVGVEALARWRHPKHGVLGADTLFAVAAQSEYLHALSSHIQHRAVSIAAAWPSVLAHVRLAVNVTAQDIARPNFAESFLNLLDTIGFPRERLTVEITESGLIEDLARAADLLAELRSGGCRVAIDDFGTGYSSLAYLKALPLDYLKIDKALAQDIMGSARDRVVVRGVIDMARSLGLSVIAEGVETEAQREALAEQGANYYQGFLCSEAVDSLALEKLVTAR